MARTVLAIVVVALALLPLVREPSFYYWDDTAAVIAPTWRAAGLDLLAGHWPTMRPDFWMGGNWAAEAQFGLWSPVNLAFCLLLAVVPDLAVGCAVIKIALLTLLTQGAYRLLLDHGCTRGWAVALAGALPFAGFTLYYDASSWVAGLAAFAWTPWFWWASRRCLHGRANPLWTYLTGYLLVTNGNPYGVLAAVVVLAALGVEGLITRAWSGLRRLVLAGLCVGTTVGVAYLPMLATAGVGWRGEFAQWSNDAQLVPNLTMLAATSTPSQLPFLLKLLNRDPALGLSPTGASTVPLLYTAWFLLPLLPWLPWSRLRGRVHELAGLAVVAAVFALMLVGPSQLWLFRWPIRLLPYVFLAATVALGVLLSAGVRTDRFVARLGVSAGVVLAGGWLALAQSPGLRLRHVAGTLLSLALVGALALVLRRRPSLGPAVLVIGTALVLACQLAWSPVNKDVMNWHFPTSTNSPFAERYAGPVIQLARGKTVPMDERATTYRELLFGSQPGMTGIESTTSYTGIGFNEFSAALCLDFAGQTCPEAFDAVWAPAGSAVPVQHLADAVKARTVIVQRALVPEAVTFEPPSGWRRGAVTDVAVVFTRDADLPWPDSRLAATSGAVTVTSATATDTTERLVVSTGSAGGAVQFARLAWPGYTTTVAGTPAEVRTNAQGLIELVLPAGLTGAAVTLDFTPPGWDVGVPLLIAGALVAVAQGAWVASGRHRSRPLPGAYADSADGIQE